MSKQKTENTKLTAVENSVFTYADIPNYCNFHDLYFKMVEYFGIYKEDSTPIHFVEVGSWLGHSTAYMVNRIQDAKNRGLYPKLASNDFEPGIKFDAIDLWKLGVWNDSDHYIQMADIVGHEVSKGYDFFHVVQDNLKKCGIDVGTKFPIDGNYDVNLIQNDSLLTSMTYPDHSLDFVFIDAGHTYEEVIKDIAFWWRKIKPGGILAGDDYNWDTVAAAVRDFAQIREDQALITLRNSWVVAKDDMRKVADRLVNLGNPE